MSNTNIQLKVTDNFTVFFQIYVSQYTNIKQQQNLTNIKKQI